MYVKLYTLLPTNNTGMLASSSDKYVDSSVFQLLAERKVSGSVISNTTMAACALR